MRRAGVSRLRLWLGLLGLLLLAVPGFALGLFAGVLWREPELVAGHWLGRTRELAADVAAPPPREAPAAAAAPSGGSTGAAAARAGTTPAAEPPQGELAAPMGPRLAVQVGAFGDSASAEKLARSLRDRGFDAFVSPSTGPAGSRWRVRVGPLASREEAERLAARLKAEQRLPTWVVEDDRA